MFAFCLIQGELGRMKDDLQKNLTERESFQANEVSAGAVCMLFMLIGVCAGMFFTICASFGVHFWFICGSMLCFSE